LTDVRNQRLLLLPLLSKLLNWATSLSLFPTISQVLMTRAFDEAIVVVTIVIKML